MRKKRLPAKLPELLACALIEDGGRILFMKTKSPDGREAITLPCTPVPKGGNPVQLLAQAVKAQAGIDAHVQAPALKGRLNAGTRKAKRWIPAIAFSTTAKSYRARPAPPFTGSVWLTAIDALAKRFTRASEWLRDCENIS
ncbi:MAG: hypothetical protein PHF51_00545 [Candidatus ainarchaeum sp.]|nr:hypothetical protein [Candidatus ainarchaeum sp.]